MDEKELKIIEKLARDGYSDANQLEADLKAAGASSSRATQIRNMFRDNISKSTSSNSGSAISKLNGLTDGIKGGIKKLGDIAFAVAYDQQNYDRSVIQVSNIKAAFDAIVDNGINIFADIGDGIKAIAGLTESVIKQTFQREGQLLESFTTRAGMAGELSKQFTNEMLRTAAVAEGLGIKFGDVRDATETMLVNSQKFATYQGETVLNALKIGAAYAQSAKAILENAEAFRNVGMSVGDTSKAIGEIGSKSLSLGLSARATTTTLTSNIGRLNEFGFQNGVKGLANMVREAQSLKFNMEETFKVADKLYDPESAINLAANLQVVGGAVGDLADPIRLMYDATNNVESLQTSILGAARSLATYNAEQGRFEVTGANLRRAKAMADALGISMNELTSAAVKGQAKMQALSELELFDLDDDQKEFISNLSSMKEGVIGIEISKDMADKMTTGIRQGFVDFSSLTGAQMKEIADVQKRLASRTTEEVIKDQYTVATRSLNALNSIAMNMGIVAKDAIEKSDAYKGFVDKLSKVEGAAEMSPEQIENEFQKYMEGIVSPVQTIIKKIKDGAGEAIEGAENLYQKGKKAAEENLPSLDNIKNKGKELINEGLEKLGIDLTVKVDINSNSTLLAGIVVDEIEKNPRIAAEFVSKILKPSNTFT